MNKLYSEIEKILDYKFKDINLLDEALTHSSIKKNNKQKKVFNYERLEFLGDRILGFVISDLLFKKFPDFQEGDLSVLFQKYTNTKFLSKTAIRLNLNKFVVVQKGDALEKKDSIMSDLIESIIAAIYIDSDLDNAKFFIENKIYRDIEAAETWEEVIFKIQTGLKPYTTNLKRNVVEDDIIRLTEIKIKRISKFDMDKSSISSLVEWCQRGWSWMKEGLEILGIEE